jgi:signal transduction histidine kinase/ligand-binding sensor domain-containing protein/DNA-binding response OmpR family regulator
MGLVKKYSGINLFSTVFFLTFISTNIHAQQSSFSFINFSSKHGLSSNLVSAIHKDRYGYMWFGTDDGLNKFDGVNFTIYKHKPDDSTSIGANGIAEICEDRDGNLWFGTDGVLSRYDNEKNAFINYGFTRFGSIRALCTDHSGNVWVGGYGGLFMFNPRTGQVKHYGNEPWKKVSKLVSNTIISAFEDSHKRLWIGTNAGLHLYMPNSDSFKTFLHSPSDPSSISDNAIRDITEDSTGNVWFATLGGLNKLQADGKSFKSYKHNSFDIHTLSHDHVYTVAVDNDGKVWAGTEDGISILDPLSEKVTRIVSENRKQYSLIGKSIRSIFIDKKGIYWVGTNHGGVNKYDKNLAFFNLRQSNPFDPFGLTNPFVSSFVEGPKGDIYIGTDGGGLNLYHPKTGLFDHPRLTSGEKYKNLKILAMERVGYDLWIGTFQEGVYVLNMQTGAVKHYLKGEGSKTLSNNEIFCIKKDSRGNVWIGTNGGGVNLYDYKSDTFKRWDKKTADSLGFAIADNGFIRAIEEDKFGNIWVGSIGAGITVYNQSSNTGKILDWSSGLPRNNIHSIYSDKAGNMWVGTPGGGLSLYDNNTGKFTTYSESSGLSNGVVYKVLEDDLGKLWVSTNKGLSCFDKRTKRFTNYSHHNGLQKSTFAFGAGLKTSAGELFFGGHDGFNYFDPSLLHSNSNVPSLVFTDLKIGNASVVPGEDAAIREHISIAKEIKLDYKQNFSLDFAALNYTSPQENRYAYKLEGFDRDWNEVGELHSAVYTNLDPGEYTFRVRAKSENGSWSTPESTIRIYVLPPIWRTPYAYVVYFLLAGATIFFIRRRNIQRFKNKLALEQERLQVKQLIEAERRETERQHHFDEQRIKFLTNLSHEFRTPISLIVGPVDKMLQGEAQSEKKEQLGLVQRNARRLLNLVNQLLDFRKLEESELKLNLSEGDIVSFIKDVAGSFKDISENKHINFHFISSVEEYYTLFDRDKMERILFNLLSNAFKFTAKGGAIKLEIEQKGKDNITIGVSDSGLGMSEEVQKKIFERFFQGDMPSVILNQGTGIGLSITREFVKLHGGTIHLQSEQGKGSSFTISLPLEQRVARNLEQTSKGEVGAEDATASTGMEEVPEGEKLPVLIIEDNDDFRGYLKENLKSFYRIVEAANGKEGWQKALSSHPKIIVSDISMPGMDGITLCRKLKSDKRTSHIPVILLTALTGDANQLRGLKTGASDYLTKPFNSQILNLKIKNLVSLNEELEKTYKKQLSVVMPKVEVQSEDEKLLLRITEYIESNIDSPNLTVEELSKHVYMSRGSLYSKILALTGETPVEFIRSIRLKRAVALLESSDMKIAEIGYAVGFATPNYFARAFKIKYNISPSEYMASKRKVDDTERQPEATS